MKWVAGTAADMGYGGAGEVSVDCDAVLLRGRGGNRSI